MSANLIPILWEATLQTIYMVVVSGLIGTVLGLPLGVFLATSKRGELLSAPALNRTLGLVVNALLHLAAPAVGQAVGHLAALGGRRGLGRRCRGLCRDGLVVVDTPVVDGSPLGVFAWRPPTALVLATSRLLAGGAA